MKRTERGQLVLEEDETPGVLSPPGSVCGARPTSSARPHAFAPPSIRSLCSGDCQCAILFCSRTSTPCL